MSIRPVQPNGHPRYINIPQHDDDPPHLRSTPEQFQTTSNDDTPTTANTPSNDTHNPVSIEDQATADNNAHAYQQGTQARETLMPPTLNPT